MPNDWILQTLQSLRDCQDPARFYKVFCDTFILQQDSRDHEDDMLFFVNGRLDADDRLQVRRMPSDGRMPETGLVPDWRETLLLNLLCRLECTMSIQLIDEHGKEMMAHRTPLFADPNEFQSSEGRRRCRLRTTFPLLAFPAGEQAGGKKLPIQQQESFQLTLSLPDGRVILDGAISYDQIQSEYLKTLKNGRMAPPGVKEEHRITLDLPLGASTTLSVATFSLTEGRLGVRTAIYSLFLRRPAHMPTRFICQPTAIYLHWEGMLEHLFK